MKTQFKATISAQFRVTIPELYRDGLKLGDIIEVTIKKGA
jgi:bifunctional DNA-binding transcriptional regulator/antitoxin component of YhaV-PrlF toxin-antitoxin module